MPPLKFGAFATRLRTQASPRRAFRFSLSGASGVELIAAPAARAYPKYMKFMFLAVGLAAATVAVAQEKTITVSPRKAETYAPQVKDPQQTRHEQTTQIVTNTAKGAPPVNYKGVGTVDEDLRQRIIVALSTGSVGTQGVLPSQLTTDIKVNVTNRVVTLSGDVASQKSKQAIAKRVAGLDGVTKVNNQLTVNPKGKPARADLFKPDGYAPGTKDERTEDGKLVNPQK